MPERARDLLVAGLFAGSGACGLAYELGWLRLLAGLFGSSLAARGIVLAMFMAGLGLGSFVAARRIARRPELDGLRTYAAVEAFAATWAALVPLSLPLALRVYAAMHPGFSPEGPGPGLTALRIALAAVMILPATTAMGASLPLVVHHFVRHPGGTTSLGRTTGLLYALNTAGAAAGVLTMGLGLAPAVGHARATWLVAAANLLIALGARQLAHAGDPPREGSSRARTTTTPAAFEVRHGPIPWALAAVTGLCNLGLELVWMRGLGVYSRSTSLANTAVLAVFIVGLAVGAALPSRRAHRIERAWGVLAATVLGVAAHALTLPRYLPALGELADPWGPLGAWGPLVVAAIALLPGTVLMGASLPLLVSLYAHRTRDSAAAAGQIYAANTLGAIVGSLLVSFWWIPSFGTGVALGVLASLAALAAAGAMTLHVRQGHGALERAPWATVGFVLAALAVLYGGPRLWRDETAPMLPRHDGADGTVIFAREDGTGLVEVVERRSGRRLLRTQRTYVWGSEQGPMLRSMLRQGALPVLLHDDPRRVLEVGLATGVQFLPVLAYDELELGRVVELSPAIVEASRSFSRTNGGLSTHPRFEVVVEDGRNYLAIERVHARLHPASVPLWDVIVLGLFTAFEDGVGDLYSAELYADAHARIADGGLVVQWLPLDQLGELGLRSAVATFLAEFPHVHAYEKAHYLALVGADHPLEIDLARAQSRLDRTHLGPLLAAPGVDAPELVLSGFVLDREGLEGFAGDAPINRARAPVIEGAPPREKPGRYIRASAALEELLARRRPELGPLLVNASPADRARIERLRKARVALLRAGIAQVRGDRAGTRAALSRAVELGPEDPLIVEQARAAGL